MDIKMVADFFMWCTILNGGLLIFWVLICMLAPDLVYRMQSKFFALPREAFDIIIYSFLGLFKIFFLIFNVVPFLALLLCN